jgi:hypothetical protein
MSWTAEDSAKMDEAGKTAEKELASLIDKITDDQKRAVALFIQWWSGNMDAGHKRLYRIATRRNK